MTCPRCDCAWDDHVQGRCPPDVEAQHRQFGCIMVIAVSLLAWYGIVRFALYVWENIVK